MNARYVASVVLLLIAQRSFGQVFIHVDSVERGAPPAKLQEEVDQLTKRLEAETDQKKRDRLRAQMERATERATSAADWMILGTRQERNDGQAFPVIVQVPKRLDSLARRLKAGMFISCEGIYGTGTQWRNFPVTISTGKRFEIAEKPDWWKDDEAAVRPWEAADPALTKSAAIEAVRVEMPEWVPPRGGDRIDTAMGTVFTGSSPGGYRYPVVLRNGGSDIAVARIIIELLDQDGDVIFTHHAALAELPAGKQQTMHVFVLKGTTPDEPTSARVHVSYLRRP